MRLVIDMQGAQTPVSKTRGVGRYTVEMTKALIATCPENWEIVLALNGAFPAACRELRDTFAPLIGPDKIKVWYNFLNTANYKQENEARSKVMKIWREVYLNSLEPTVIFAPNLQEGLYDQALTSVKLVQSNALYCSTLHDVSPLLYPEKMLTDEFVTKWYYERLDFAAKSDILLTVSEFSRGEISARLGVSKSKIWVAYSSVDQDRFCQDSYSDEERKNILARYGIGKKFILYAGGTDIHKNIFSLYAAYASLPRELKAEYQLVLLGRDFDNHRAEQEKLVEMFGILEQVVFIGYASDEEMTALYRLCSLFVYPSILEGFGLPPLEAVSCGAVAIVSNAASLPEVVGTEEALFEPRDIGSIRDKIAEVLTRPEVAERLRNFEQKHAKKFSWRAEAKAVWKLFAESLPANMPQSKMTDPVSAFIEAAGKLPEFSQLLDVDLKQIALSISESFPVKSKRRPKLFLDASATIEVDTKTGIQRVVRAVCSELCTMSLPVDAEVVYAVCDKYGLYRAADFMSQIKGCPIKADSKPVEVLPGDIVLKLDLHPLVVRTTWPETLYYMARGVKVYHIVYDLLPITLRKGCFEEAFCRDFEDGWLKYVLQTDGVICDSETICRRVEEYIRKKRLAVRHFHLGWFHLGADVSKSLPSKGLPPDAAKCLEIFKNKETFLMVGTVEPRKGHRQILQAMEILWAKGFNGNLVIVGRFGWNMEDFVQTVKQHRFFNKKLFWLNGISDEYLEKVYASSTCLIAASEDEGFGLPLIEAAGNKIPIIARDIEVFHEVAGEYAFYFDGSSDDKVAASLENWLVLYREGKHPSSVGMPFLTWRESAQQLWDAIGNDKWWKILNT